MSTLLQDLVYAIRQLRRQPLFAACAVLTLAIGMGVNAVAFTVVNGVLFKGTATSEADGVGRIATSARDDVDGNASVTEYGQFVEVLRPIGVSVSSAFVSQWARHRVISSARCCTPTPDYWCQE